MVVGSVLDNKSQGIMRRDSEFKMMFIAKSRKSKYPPPAVGSGSAGGSACVPVTRAGWARFQDIIGVGVMWRTH